MKKRDVNIHSLMQWAKKPTKENNVLLKTGLIWKDTPQGHNYWLRIWSGIEKLSIEEMDIAKTNIKQIIFKYGTTYDHT